MQTKMISVAALMVAILASAVPALAMGHEGGDPNNTAAQQREFGHGSAR